MKLVVHTRDSFYRRSLLEVPAKAEPQEMLYDETAIVRFQRVRQMVLRENITLHEMLCGKRAFYSLLAYVQNLEGHTAHFIGGKSFEVMGVRVLFDAHPSTDEDEIRPLYRDPSRVPR